MSASRSPSPTPTTLRPPQDPQPEPESSSRRRQDDTQEQQQEPMAKRIRRLSPEHSSPSSDESQDDHKPDAPSTSAPPKKKRTRTLTTPHQSAVLHALLAQSRFPTTAMREEVGRSIGLSARKVQIWFQNQRQKSRRPRSQSDTPGGHLPQYGPFPTGGGGDPLSQQHSMHAYDDHAHMPYGAHAPPPELSPSLLGPGMPGVPPGHQPQNFRRLPPPPPLTLPPHAQYTRPAAPRPLLRAPSPPPYRSPRMYPHPGVRPATAQSASWRAVHDPSRTLPPLGASRPPSAPYGASFRGPSSFPPVQPAAAHAQSLLLHARRSLSPDAVFAHAPPPPEPSPGSASASATTTTRVHHLPPPFTLEPAPQWDEAAYSAVPRPSSSAWPSRPSSRRRPSTRGRSTSPVASRRDSYGAELPLPLPFFLGDHPHARPMSSPLGASPPARGGGGRYDPVRAAAALAFPPPPPTTASPAHSDAPSPPTAAGPSSSRLSPPPPPPPRQQ